MITGVMRVWGRCEGAGYGPHVIPDIICPIDKYSLRNYWTNKLCYYAKEGV